MRELLMRYDVATLVLCCCIVVCHVCEAQQAPVGWRWQLDHAARTITGQADPKTSLRLQEMVPGMHITTATGVVLLAPGDGAVGRFIVDAEMLLFPNSSDGGYGIMIGGSSDEASLDFAATHWIGFVVSGDGRFAVLRHTPERTTSLVDWRAHESVVPRSTDVVTNRLRVAVEPDSVRFVINQKQVAALPRAGLQLDGLFGLRIEDGVNVHVTNVDIVKRLLRR
jgi:hypothetical protein